MATNEPVTPKPRKKYLRWFAWVAGTFVLFELLAGQFVARPNRILRPSADTEMVYENSPGTWLGHAKYDVWTAPLYMVLDFVYMGNPGHHTGAPPIGYTVYRIDEAGCRLPAEGSVPAAADAVLLGSSQAFGLLVPYEDTVSAMLERELTTREGRPMHVANCSVVGHHMLPTLRTGELVRPHKQPKLNIVLVRPWHMLEQFDYTKVTSPQNPVLRWFFERSNFVRLSFYIYRRQSSQFEAPYYAMDRVEAKLDDYAAKMRPQGVRTLFVLLDDKHTESAALFEKLTPVLRKRDFAVERVWTPTEGKEYFIDHDQHWNAKGAALTTSSIIDAVQRELRLAASAPSPAVVTPQP